jgi:hypothetical protein
MAIFTPKEFYTLCGISKGNFYTYKKRGNIHTSEDGTIDSLLPMNADFMNKRVMNKKTIPPPTLAHEVARVDTVVVAKPKKKTKDELASIKRDIVRQEDADAQATHKYNLDRQIKEAELEAKEQTIELNKLKIAKLSGEVIPTDLVRIIFAQHFRSVSNAFNNAADNYISVIIAKFNGKKDDVAFIRGELINVVNEAIKDAIAESKHHVGNIVSEYSSKRGKGESR